MSDLENTPNGDGGQVPNDPASVPQAPANDNISLSKQEYAQLMSNMAALQTQLEMQQQYSAEARGDRNTQQPQEPVDLNSLTNEQLLNLINQQIGQPILQVVMQMAVKEELREVRSKYNDFDTLKDQVYAIASKNTTLTLEDAYKLAKSGQPAPAPTPPRPADPPPAAPPAQRGGVTPSAVNAVPAMSVRDAAAAALKNLQYE